MQKREHLHKDIIEGCKQGKNKDRYRLYELYSKAMFNVSYRIMGNREEAEDMLQEAFVQAFQKLHTYRYESGFGYWLKRIVVNTCINAIKKRKVDLVYCEEIYTNGYSEEDEGNEEYGTKKIIEAMKQLPEGGRTIFSLYLLEGYDHREISKILNISESTSKSQYKRAKDRIKKILKEKNT